jgi:hypothetical protein
MALCAEGTLEDAMDLSRARLRNERMNDTRTAGRYNPISFRKIFRGILHKTLNFMFYFMALLNYAVN